MLRVLGALAVASILPVGAAANAQSVSGYGSAVYTTMRACGAEPGSVCDGQQARLSQSNLSGGPGVEANTTYTGSGIGAGSSAFGAVRFGGLGLPSVSASASAVGNVRVNTNIFFYQTYTYNGADPIDFGLSGSMHIDSSTTDNSTGVYENGAYFFTGLSIWDAASFQAPTVALDFLGDDNYEFSPACGEDGVLAAGNVGAALPGGEQTYGFATSSCSGGGAIQLHNGEQFVVAGLLQFPVNRGGSIDATHTLSVALDPALGAETTQALTQNLSFAAAPAAVPEPLTWACMTLGFGAIGAAARRRRTALPA